MNPLLAPEVHDRRVDLLPRGTRVQAGGTPTLPGRRCRRMHANWRFPGRVGILPAEVAEGTEVAAHGTSGGRTTGEQVAVGYGRALRPGAVSRTRLSTIRQLPDTHLPLRNSAANDAAL